MGAGGWGNAITRRAHALRLPHSRAALARTAQVLWLILLLLTPELAGAVAPLQGRTATCGMACCKRGRVCCRGAAAGAHGTAPGIRAEAGQCSPNCARRAVEHGGLPFSEKGSAETFRVPECSLILCAEHAAPVLRAGLVGERFERPPPALSSHS